MDDLAHRMSYRAEPSSTRRIESNRWPADPVQAYFLKNPLNRIKLGIRHGSEPYRPKSGGMAVWLDLTSNQTVLTTYGGWGCCGGTWAVNYWQSGLLVSMKIERLSQNSWKMRSQAFDDTKDRKLSKKLEEKKI